MVLLSTSTTGYAALAIMLAGLALYAFVIGSGALKKRVLAGLFGAGVVVALAIATAPVVAPSLAHQAVSITNATLNKQRSSSYQDRTSTDLVSLREVVESDGLGVGWGSNRSSSLIPGLAAGIGIWGIAGLLWFVSRILSHVRTAQRLATSPALKLVIHGSTGSILGLLAASVLSGPGITSPDFYLQLALLIAAAGRMRWEAHTIQAPLPRFAAFARPSALAAERDLRPS